MNINEGGDLDAERSVQPCTDRSLVFGALLEAIRADPDDDAPRLVYADACDDARGELIVAQCALAAGDDREELARRDIDLLAAHGAAWFAHLGPFTEAVVHRGFVERLAIPVAELLVAETFAREPAITQLSLSDPSDGGWLSAKAAHLLCLLQHPELARIRRLDLPQRIDRVGLLIVGRSERLAKLSSLRIRDPVFGDDAFRTFAEENALASLEELVVESSPALRRSNNELRFSLAQLVAPRLRVLSLRGAGISAAALLAFAGSEGCAQLASIDLRGNGVEPQVLAALLARPRLRTLRLGAVGFRREHALALTGARHAPQLVQLDLAETHLDEYVDLLGAAELPALRDLDLGLRQSIRSIRRTCAFAAIWRAPWLSQLETLRLDGRAIGDGGLAALLARPLPTLRTLTLADCDLGEDAIFGLVTADLPSLEMLDISNNVRIRHETLQRLTHAPWMRRLRALHADSPIEVAMPRLRELRVPEARAPRIHPRSAAFWPAR